MLMNDFYTYRNLHEGDHELTCQVVFNDRHDIFQGHFPGEPVVPGVCMMEMVKELLQTLVGKPLWLRNAGNVKFLQLITPDVEPEVRISWNENDKGYAANASFNLNHSALFKLSGNYEEM
jgi:3-hydroxyacyl-[acyl-carrier-protein] dehydratase